MKKLLTYLILGIYILAAFKPYLPVIQYAVNYDFYKNVLCENKAKPELKCNGKCHLMKQMAATQDQNSTTKLPIPKLDLSKLPLSPIVAYVDIHLPVFSENSVANYAENTGLVNSVWYAVATPPPDKL